MPTFSVLLLHISRLLLPQLGNVTRKFSLTQKRVKQWYGCWWLYRSDISDEFKFKLIIVEDVIKVITSLNGSISFGLDKIPAKILKDSSDRTAPIITHISNRSLRSCIFPDDWKKARLSPICKSGDKEDCWNHGRISVSSVVSKIFEKLLYSYKIHTCILVK